MRSILIGLVLSLVLSLGHVNLASADDQTYWTAATGSWLNSANWSAGVPTPTHYAIVNNGGTTTIMPKIWPPEDAVCAYLYLPDHNGGSGNAEIPPNAYGWFRADAVLVGYWGSGTFTQSNGMAALSSGLYVGRWGGSGTYDLQGGTLTAGAEDIGLDGGTGYFYHSAGTNHITGTATVGCGGPGWYYLNGTGELQAPTVAVGNYGVGVFEHDGGTCTISDNLFMGGHGGTGTYKLISGDMSAAEEWIGRSTLNNLFTQSGGTNTVSGVLYVPQSSGGGTYELKGGALSANRIDIGGGGSGAFNWTGGSLSANTINIGANGTMYRNADWTYGKTMNICGGLLDLGWKEFIIEASGGGAFVTLSDGDLQCKMQYVGLSSAGTVTQSGGTNLCRTSLSLGHFAGSTGQYDLSNGTIWIDQGSEYIGYVGSGVLNQSGGTNDIYHDLYLGYWPGGSGTYNLSGGDLYAGGSKYVGHNGNGTFNQTGGTNSCRLYLGHLPGSRGTYSISGGALSAEVIRVGHGGSGTFDIANVAAAVSISDTLVLGNNSTYQAVPGATIHMTGVAFENLSDDPPALVGLHNTCFIFEGGTWDTSLVEVGGRDYGTELPEINFDLGGLVIGGSEAGAVVLVDMVDNQPGWDGNEVIYVQSLVVGPGSYLNLNGLSLYYDTASIDPSSTIELSGGELVQADAWAGLVNEPVGRPGSGVGPMLEPNVPNPFHPQTMIAYSIAEAAHVSLEIFDASGRCVRVLVDHQVAAGRHAVEWDGQDHFGHACTSGVYFCRLVTGGTTATRKMILAK